MQLSKWMYFVLLIIVLIILTVIIILDAIMYDKPAVDQIFVLVPAMIGWVVQIKKKGD